MVRCSLNSDIAISKTADERELEAWGWLMERIGAWRAEQMQGG